MVLFCTLYVILKRGSICLTSRLAKNEELGNEVRTTKDNNDGVEDKDWPCKLSFPLQ